MSSGDERGRTFATLVLALSALLAGGCGIQGHPRTSVDDQTGGGGAPFGQGDASVIVVPDAQVGSGTGGNIATGGVTGTGGAAGGSTGAGGAPASGIIVNIAGNSVPKEKVLAFIHIGHSNMAGRASGPTGTRPYFFTDVDTHAWMYHTGPKFQPALEPATAGDSGNGTGTRALGGPGTALVKQAAAMAPGYYAVSLGFGAASAYCSQFLPGGLYYDTLIAAAKQLKGGVTFAGIMILLGITERHGTAADITGYPACINKLVTAIRTDVGEPNLPLLLCDYEAEATGELAPTGAFAQQIIPQIRMVPNMVSNSVLVPTNGLGMQDDHHFNLDGHKEYTRRLLQLMKDKGWFPWSGP